MGILNPFQSTGTTGSFLMGLFLGIGAGLLLQKYYKIVKEEKI